MKQQPIFNLALAGLVAALAVTGCRTKQPDKGITVIRGARPGVMTDPDLIGGANTTPRVVTPPDNGLPVLPPPPPPPTTAIAPPISEQPQPPPSPFRPDTSIPGVRGNLADYDQDRSSFALNTVYFDYDRSTVKPAYVTKINEVALIIKAMPANRVLIEGHCDERGTEEYNRALGERRALAVREQLVRAGISPDRIFTLSFGKDRAAQLGHDEASWSKNRRGEFVLLRPRAGGASNP